jgi:hypothetical protein
MNYPYSCSDHSKSAFDDAAKAHVDKLKFNTREEYLLWVQQWKEDYKHILFLHKLNKLAERLPGEWINMKLVPIENEKRARLEKQMEVLKTKFDENKAKKISDELSQVIQTEQNIHWIGGSGFSTYHLILYLLVCRKASKIRAGVKREERKKLEVSL